MSLMRSPHWERGPRGGTPYRQPPMYQHTSVGGVFVAAVLLVACGGNPTEFAPPPNDSCLGNAVALRPLTDTVLVGDSVHVLALRTPAFAACLSGLPFVFRWEARPDSAVVLSADSDTSAWIRGVIPGTLSIFARITSMDDIEGQMTLVVR